MPKRAFAEQVNKWQLLVSGLKKNENELSLPVKTEVGERLPNFGE